MKVNGACHCGAIKIEADADPEKVTICHCTDCQTGTGSAFRVSVPVAGSDFKMTGKPVNYVKMTADSGNPRVQAFCGQCGSPIYSTTPGEGLQASYMVRVGILAQRDPLSRLSHRQRVVLQLIAEGCTNKEIAARLKISERTVDCHRTELMRRLDMHEIASLVRFAVQEGVIHLD